MIKAVIFDMDGVIVDTGPMHFEASRQTLNKYGAELTEELFQTYRGMREIESYQKYLDHFSLDLDAEELVKKREEVFLDILKRGFEPSKDIINLLKDIKKGGLRLSLASSSDKIIVHAIIDSLGITNLFDSIINGDMVRKGKPEPDIFLTAANGLNENPSECVVVEDAYSGVQAAKAAGMKCIGYMCKGSGHQDLSAADIIIDDFNDLTLEKIQGL